MPLALILAAGFLGGIIFTNLAHVLSKNHKEAKTVATVQK